MEKENKEEILLCPICGRELDEPQQNYHPSTKGWLCRCGEFIPYGTAISNFTGSSDRLTGEYHRRIKG